jgi:hypothetical protein
VVFTTEDQYESLLIDSHGIRDLLDELDLCNESGPFVDEMTGLYADGELLFKLDDSRFTCLEKAPHLRIEATGFNVGDDGGHYLVRAIPAHGTWLRLEVDQEFDISKLLGFNEQVTFLGSGTGCCVGKIVTSLNYADWEEGEFEFESSTTDGEVFYLVDTSGTVKELEVE